MLKNLVFALIMQLERVKKFTPSLSDFELMEVSFGNLKDAIVCSLKKLGKVEYYLVFKQTGSGVALILLSKDFKAIAGSSSHTSPKFIAEVISCWLRGDRCAESVYSEAERDFLSACELIQGALNASSYNCRSDVLVANKDESSVSCVMGVGKSILVSGFNFIHNNFFFSKGREGTKSFESFSGLVGAISEEAENQVSIPLSTQLTPMAPFYLQALHAVCGNKSIFPDMEINCTVRSETGLWVARLQKVSGGVDSRVILRIPQNSSHTLEFLTKIGKEDHYGPVRKSAFQNSAQFFAEFTELLINPGCFPSRADLPEEIIAKMLGESLNAILGYSYGNLPLQNSEGRFVETKYFPRIDLGSSQVFQEQDNEHHLTYATTESRWKVMSVNARDASVPKIHPDLFSAHIDWLSRVLG